MLRKFGMLLSLSCISAACVWAQGLTTQASKDDWEEINFEFNSAVLSDGYPSLLCLADRLHKNPGYHVKVEGNADNIGSNRFNERLGLARATTVKDFLVKYGAAAGQVEVASRGKNNPEVQGFKGRYSKTDVPRWMNRRVVLTVTDDAGKVVTSGCNENFRPVEPPKNTGLECCNDILKKLDELANLLNQMRNDNADLRKQLADHQNAENAEHDKLEKEIAGLPKPLTEQQTEHVVQTEIEKARDPRFSLLGLNVGADDTRHVSFSGSGRFFAPFKEHFALQVQGEYLYFRNQKEGQGDIGIVNRFGNFQGGLFASFKNVSFGRDGGNGTLGQGAAVFEWINKIGKVGVFGTKGFLTTAGLSTNNLVLNDGSQAPNIFVERYLRVVDQVGVQGTFGLWGNNYLEANLGYLRAFGVGDRPGGTVRFIFPLNTHFAVTVEGGVNETLLGPSNSGRAVVGLQLGNLQRPKEYATTDRPLPMQIPRVRYEVLTRNIHRGASPPIADAGPDQIGVPAGTITLNGSNSRDPNGEALTYQWVQETGPAVSISGANQAIATFSAVSGQSYTFRLTVRNTDNLQASARVRISTNAPSVVSILFFNANPTAINAGQTSQLSWSIQNATSATITPGIGAVNPSNGTITVAPTMSTTYTLTATNANGSQSQSVNIIVNQTAPTFSVCTVVPMNITSGESATIFYQTLNATSVSISPNVGSVGTNGSVVVSPTTDTNYTLTANGQFGSGTCSVAVHVTAGAVPRIVRFSASPLNIPQGGTSTLLWLVENATSVSISPVVGSVANADTRDVQPAATTTYTLTATNQFGSVTAQALVTVLPAPQPQPPPAITSFTATPPQSPNPGSPVVLTCKATNAQRIVISGIGNVDANGNLTVNPTTTTTYVCVAVGPTGLQASSNLTVPVGTTGAGPSGGPTIVIRSPVATCTGGVSSTTVCQTVVRSVTLDLTGSTSPSGNTPLTYQVTSNQSTAVVLNPTSSMPVVQLSELFGDYIFTVTATDAKGISSTATVDIQLVVTRVQ